MRARIRTWSAAAVIVAAFAAGYHSDHWVALVDPKAARGRTADLANRLDVALANGDSETAGVLLVEVGSLLGAPSDRALHHAAEAALAGDTAEARAALERRIDERTGLARRPAAQVALTLARKHVDRGDTGKAIERCLPVWSDDSAPMELRMEAGLRMAQALRVERDFARAKQLQDVALSLPVRDEERRRLLDELGL